MSFRIGPSYRYLFKSICYRMCAIATMAEYNEQKQHGGMSGSITCFLLLEALATLTLKCHTQLWLLEAAKDDTPTMLTQINEFHSFFAHATSSSSKVPCFLAHDRANRSTHIHAAKAYMAGSSNKCAWHKAIEENTNPQVFVLTSGARQRPLKTKRGIEGTFCVKRNQIKQQWMLIKTCM